MDTSNLIQTVSVYALPVIFAITLHEAAHGYAAKYFGDRTAYMMGRVTLNPFAHIHWVGTILLPLLLYFSTSGALLFGYAKPVPVNFGNLRHPKRDMIWVALAGPGSNLIQAIVWALLYVVYIDFGVTEKFFLAMCKAGVLSNVVMFAFNLFPLPPLDGGRIVVGLLPWRQAYQFSRIEPYGFFIVMALAITGVVNHLWLDPVMNTTFGLIELILKSLT
ncbi:MAG: site-2 protease family protein [Betaproteobacteria bacterium]|nr:site-2 protease family protein [Betaproteobacteria bacterium]NBZ99345.1 site-2 protease family protein [Betaproteobacteria bacterium]NDB43584.1 site-2 protease family protein [Betaproteobacteria bacterium]NDD23919.1 site-2 protease family protein [Betaproteobacteria bacterium]NDF77936.1 site-2 protease family protein [Betaproteobacteria bacterium]